MIFLAKSIPTKEPLEAPPPRAKFLGQGVGAAPVVSLGGLRTQDQGPSQQAVALEAQPRLSPSLARPWLLQQGARGDS